MRRGWLAMAALASALPLSAAPVPGTIRIEVAGDALPPEVRAAVGAAVADELAALGFVSIPAPGRGRYLARVAVTREPRGLVTSPSPRVPMTTALGGWALGMRVPLPSGKNQLRMLYATRLAITLARSQDDTSLWRGEAVTVQPEGSRADAPGALAAKLTRAIVASYPDTAPEAIAVP